MMAWSVVALQERTVCSNLPSTGTAVLTTGGNLPVLQPEEAILQIITAYSLNKNLLSEFNNLIDLSIGAMQGGKLIFFQHKYMHQTIN